MSFAPLHSDPNYQALYIHIPFCARRCRYCDFVTEAVTADDPRIDSHIAGLGQSLAAAAAAGQLADIQTIYIGGGTPSYIGGERFAVLLEALQAAVDLASVQEFTVEANPDSLSFELLECLVNGGVNRISLGVQSLADRELAALGRIHDSTQALAAIHAAVRAVGNVSVDLICGIPGQDEASLLGSLAMLVDCGVAHLSVYPLTLEPGTALARDVENGLLTVADEDGQADLLLAAAAYLEGRGFTHYELASYARDGMVGRHNLVYWTALPYLGLGRGAVSMGMRGGVFGSLPSPVRCRFDEQGVIEELTAAEAAAEDLMLRLRLLAGAPDGLVAQVQELLPQAFDCLAELVGLSLLEHVSGSYRLRGDSWLLGNQVFGRILELADTR